MSSQINHGAVRTQILETITRELGIEVLTSRELATYLSGLRRGLKAPATIDLRVIEHLIAQFEDVSGQFSILA